jgi:hypothetical protein
VSKRIHVLGGAGFNRENGAPCRIWVIIYGAVAPQSGALFSLIV